MATTKNPNPRYELGNSPFHLNQKAYLIAVHVDTNVNEHLGQYDNHKSNKQEHHVHLPIGQGISSVDDRRLVGGGSPRKC